MALLLGLTSAARTTGGGIPRSMQKTPRRPVLLSAVALIAMLAAVLFTGQPASAQSENEDLIQVTVSFLSGRYTAVEGGSVRIGVKLSDYPGREVVIPIVVTHRGGASAADYAGVPSSVTFGSDEDIRAFNITAAADSDDDGESVRLSFGSVLPDGVSAGPAVNVWITDHGEVGMGLAQVGVGVSAYLWDYDVTYDTPDDYDGEESIDNATWQWQRSATEDGTYSDIPAAEAGTSNPYTPSAGDLGMWLKAKVTYDHGANTGRTAQGIARQPVLAQPALSNAGLAHRNTLVYGYGEPESKQYAQGFTTGSDTRGYLLTAVRLALSRDSFFDAVRGTWAVHADDAGKPASAPLSAARPIQSSDLGVVFHTFEEFTHPDGVQLQPGAKYWIVISRTTPRHAEYIWVSALTDWDGSLGDGLHDVIPSELVGSERVAYVRQAVANFDAPPLDSGSQVGWSLNPTAMGYVGIDDDVNYQYFPELVPWQHFLAGARLPILNRFVLRMSLRVAPDVTVQFTQGSYTVAEGEMQTVTVQLSAAPERSLVIPIMATGEDGATSADYTVLASATFTAGQTSQTIDLTATQDTVDDDDESVKLSFGTMPDAWVSAGTTDEVTLTITDDDDPFVTVQFETSAYTVAESDDATTTGAAENEVDVTVTLSADPERTVIIPIEAAGQDGATSADYSNVPSA